MHRPTPNHSSGKVFNLEEIVKSLRRYIMASTVAESRKHFDNHFGGSKSLEDIVKRSSKTPKALKEGDVPLEDRDFFAMHAIPGIISWMEQGRINEDWSDWTMEDVADHAYELADAMLKSRQKKNKGR